MKQLLITIAAVVLVGCGPSVPDISIHDAAIEGNIEKVKQHLADGTDVNIKDKDGASPLHFAAGSGHKEVVELLIARGADVNEGTPLNYAAFNGGKEIAEMLIAKGADVNAKTKNGITPLDFAIDFKQSETADLLRKHGGKTGDWLKAGESIHIAARVGHIEAVKQHLDAGTDVNAKDRREKTPLHIVAIYGQKEIGELLITNGADVNAKSRNGETPLYLAIGFEQAETADLLRKHGGKTGEELEAEGK